LTRSALKTSFPPAFADVKHGNLRLLLSGPTSPAGAASRSCCSTLPVTSSSFFDRPHRTRKASISCDRSPRRGALICSVPASLIDRDIVQPEQKFVIEEFGRRRARQLALGYVIIPLALIAVWLEHHAQANPFGSLLFLAMATPVIVMALLFSLKNWRCPACNTYLGKRANPSACPKCGVRLHN
jgi:hypothetical protein